VKTWIASLRTTFGAKSTWKISTREIFDIAMALTSLNLQPAGSARRSNVGLIKVKSCRGRNPQAQLGEQIT
jgi:hypothetical protein